MPRVTVIVPIFNGMTFLPAFFESLKGALPAGSEVILVDDGSTEPVWATVSEIPQADGVVRLRNESNLGYSVAVNRAFGVSTGDVIVQLNSDLVLDRGCVTAMLELIKREQRVGIVGSKLVLPTTGGVQHVGMAFGNFTKPHVYSGLPADHPLCCRTREVQITTGATVAMTRRVLERIGPLNESYFNMNEDIEHCLLAVRAGLRNFVCAESLAYHWTSHSGPSRFAREDPGEAIFWTRWGASHDIDLDRFVDEALEHVLEANPRLVDFPFQIVDCSRGPDQTIVMRRLEARWPGIGERVHQHRQMNNPAPRLHLPLLLPHWIASEPRPFVYIVDRHDDLTENKLWFAGRRSVVDEELIVDLHGSALTTSEFLDR